MNFFKAELKPQSSLFCEVWQRLSLWLQNETTFNRGPPAPFHLIAGWSSAALPPVPGRMADSGPSLGRRFPPQGHGHSLSLHGRARGRGSPLAPAGVLAPLLWEPCPLRLPWRPPAFRQSACTRPFPVRELQGNENWFIHTERCPPSPPPRRSAEIQARVCLGSKMLRESSGLSRGGRFLVLRGSF